MLTRTDVTVSDTTPLRARLAELEAAIRRVAAERDAALAELERLRGAPTEAVVGEAVALDESACPACDGEGYFGVHDIRMDCKRCGGTGRAQ